MYYPYRATSVEHAGAIPFVIFPVPPFHDHEGPPALCAHLLHKIPTESGGEIYRLR